MNVTIFQTDLALTQREKEMEGKAKMEKMQDRNATHRRLNWPGLPGIIKLEQEQQRCAILSSSVHL